MAVAWTATRILMNAEVLGSPTIADEADLRTLQKRVGHSDLKTMMEHLHFIEPEAHLMDSLPY